MSPNSGFWVVPAATAFAGSTGTMIAVLANVITTAWGAVAVHLMRRDAPFRQRRATSWVDQSPILASVVGLLLHVVGPAPAWTADVLILAGPLLAFSGAALFTGSVIHPHNLSVPRTEHAVRRWAWLTAVRVAYYAWWRCVARRWPASTPLAVVAVLSGAQRAVVPAHSARGALRLPLRGRRGGRALGLAPGAARPGAGRAGPLAASTSKSGGRFSRKAAMPSA